MATKFIAGHKISTLLSYVLYYNLKVIRKGGAYVQKGGAFIERCYK